jgi:ribonuclease G
VRSKRSVCYEILRELRREMAGRPAQRFVVVVHPAVRDALLGTEKTYVDRLTRKLGVTLRIDVEAEYHVEQFTIRRG